MQIRVFEAITMQDAIQKVKSHLGKDAIILSSEETNFDGTGQKGIRVKAAASRSYDDDFSQHISSEILKEIKTISKEIEEQKNITDQLNEVHRSLSILKGLEESQREIRNLLCLNNSDKLSKSIATKNRQISSLLANLTAKGIFNEHIMELKNILEDFYRSHQNEIKSGNKIKSTDDDFNLLQAFCLKWVLSNIEIYRSIETRNFDRSFHAFIGPGGSGKSLLISKLADHLNKKFNDEVTVFSIDQSNKSTDSQLATFCKVYGIGYKEVSSAADIENILCKHSKPVKFVLIDTPGLSPGNLSAIEKLGLALQGNLPIEKHLMMDMVAKPEFLDRSIQSFSKTGISSLCFSKIDESWTHGEIYSFSKKWQIPISLLSYGESVVGKFEQASAERIIERLFNL